MNKTIDREQTTNKPNRPCVEEIERALLQNANALTRAIELRAVTAEKKDARSRLISECLDTFAAMREPFGKLTANA